MPHRAAQHMWAFLDEMAERDPEEYKTYMKKQQQEARQAAEAAEAQRPKPVFAMRTSATPTAEQGQDDRASMLNINGVPLPSAEHQCRRLPPARRRARLPRLRLLTADCWLLTRVAVARCRACTPGGAD